MPSIQQECSYCGKRTYFLCIKEATAILGNSRRTIHYWLKHGKLHGIKIPSGRTLICQSSLFLPYENSAPKSQAS
jgi:hypothetical protein